MPNLVSPLFFLTSKKETLLIDKIHLIFNKMFLENFNHCHFGNSIKGTRDSCKIITNKQKFIVAE